MTHKLFAVITWGCAATAWLAKALNSHPEIFCSHSGNQHWINFGRAPSIAGLELMTVMDAIADDCYLAAGDVHGLNRDQVFSVREKFGDRFQAVVLVREPVARLRSQIALFKQGNYSYWGELSYVNPLAESVGIDPGVLSKEQRHFIHGANMLNAILEEKLIGQIYRSEDVTTSSADLIKLLIDLTGGSVPFSPMWAEAAVSSRKINVHRSVRVPFTSFELQAIRTIVKPAAWDEYRRLGYSEPQLD